MVQQFSRATVLLALLGALCLAGFAHAQQGTAPATADGQTAQQSEDVGNSATDSNDQDAAAEETTTPTGADADDDNASDADDAPVGDSPSRFIPTEQVSQDLGVSFPVDI